MMRQSRKEDRDNADFKSCIMNEHELTDLEFDQPEYSSSDSDEPEEETKEDSPENEKFDLRQG